MSHGLRDQRAETAHHEAVHAVISYLLLGSAGSASIVPSDDTLGRHHDEGATDSMCYTDLEAFVVILYTGGAAQRMYDPAVATEGCGQDEEQAEQLLRRIGGLERQSHLRDRAASLVNGIGQR